MRLRSNLYRHYLAIILAVITSLIVAAPQIYFRIDHRDDGIYQGIELLPDSPWSPRVREIQDGHGLGSIYYKDGKESPYLFQPLGSATVGYLGKILHLDINNTILFSRLTLPFAAFFLFYMFSWKITGDKLVAIAGASLVLLADAALSLGGLLRISQGMGPSSFLELARPVNSAMIFIPFFAFLCVFWKFYRDGGWKWGVVSAAALGLNFYNYFYTWTYLYAFGGILLLIHTWRKEWPAIKRLVGVFAGALVVAMPYVINLYQASQHPSYAEAKMRFGMVSTREPIFVGLSVLVAIVIFVFLFPRQNKDKFFFSLALLVAPFVTLNQQILTGKVLQAGHYHWYFHKPMAVVFVLASISYLLVKHGFHQHKRIIFSFLTIVSFAVGIFTQTVSYARDLPGRDGGAVAVERQKYGPVMRWLSESAEPESVILANDEISHMVVIYTPLNVFHHRAAIYTLPATKDRLLDVLSVFYRLTDVNVHNAEKVFSAERGYISSILYGMHYKENFGSYEAIPDDKLQWAVNAYRQRLQTPVSSWLQSILEKYEVSYVVWDRKKNPKWNLDQFDFLDKATEFGDMVIYRFNS